ADGTRALWFLAALGGPVFWLTRQALLSRPAAANGGTPMQEWYPPGLLLGWLSALAAALIGVVFLLAADEEGGLKGLLIRQIEQVIAGVVGSMPGIALRDPAFLHDRIGFAATVLPATYALSWMLLMLGNGSLAQWGVKRMGRALRPTPRWTEL